MNSIRMFINNFEADYDTKMNIKLEYNIFSPYEPEYRGFPSTFNINLPKTANNIKLFSYDMSFQKTDRMIIEIKVGLITVIKGLLVITSENKDFWKGNILSTDENWVEYLQDTPLKEIKYFYDSQLSLFKRTARITEHYQKFIDEFGLKRFADTYINDGDVEKYNRTYNSYLAATPLSVPILSYGKFYRLPIKSVVKVNDEGKMILNGIFNKFKDIDRMFAAAEPDSPVHSTSGRGIEVSGHLLPHNSTLYFKKVKDQKTYFPFQNIVILNLCLNEEDGGKYSGSVQTANVESFGAIDENEIYEVYMTTEGAWDKDGNRFVYDSDGSNYAPVKQKVNGLWAVFSDRVKNNMLCDTLFVEDIPPVFNQFSILQHIFGQFDITLKVDSQIYDLLNNKYLTFSSDKDFIDRHSYLNSYRMRIGRFFDKTTNIYNTENAFRMNLGGIDPDAWVADSFYNNGYSVTKSELYGNTWTNSQGSQVYDAVVWYQMMPIEKVEDHINNTLVYDTLFLNFQNDYNNIGVLPVNKYSIATNQNAQKGIDLANSSNSPLIYGGTYRFPINCKADIELRITLTDQVSAGLTAKTISDWDIPGTGLRDKPCVMAICRVKDFIDFEDFDSNLLSLIATQPNFLQEGKYNDRIIWYKNIAEGGSITLDEEIVVNITEEFNKNDELFVVFMTPLFREITDIQNTPLFSYARDPQGDSLCSLTVNIYGERSINVAENLPDMSQMDYFKDILVQNKLLPIFNSTTKTMTLKSYSDCEDNEGYVYLDNSFSIIEADTIYNKPYKLMNIGYKLEDKDYLLKKKYEDYNFYVENDSIGEQSVNLSQNKLQYLFNFGAVEEENFEFFSKPLRNITIQSMFGKENPDSFNEGLGVIVNNKSFDYRDKVVCGVATITDKDNYSKSNDDVNWNFNYLTREVFINSSLGDRCFFQASAPTEGYDDDYYTSYYNPKYNNTSFSGYQDSYSIGVRRHILENYMNLQTIPPYINPISNQIYFETENQVNQYSYIATKPFDYKLLFERHYKLKFFDESKNNPYIKVEGFLDIYDYKRITNGTVLAYFNNNYYNIVSVDEYDPVNEKCSLTLIKKKYGR